MCCSLPSAAEESQQNVAFSWFPSPRCSSQKWNCWRTHYNCSSLPNDETKHRERERESIKLVIQMSCFILMKRRGLQYPSLVPSPSSVDWEQQRTAHGGPSASPLVRRVSRPVPCPWAEWRQLPPAGDSDRSVYTEKAEGLRPRDPHTNNYLVLWWGRKIIVHVCVYLTQQINRANG